MADHGVSLCGWLCESVWIITLSQHLLMNLLLSLPDSVPLENPDHNRWVMEILPRYYIRPYIRNTKFASKLPQKKFCPKSRTTKMLVRAQKELNVQSERNASSGTFCFAAIQDSTQWPTVSMWVTQDSQREDSTSENKQKMREFYSRISGQTEECQVSVFQNADIYLSLKN